MSADGLLRITNDEEAWELLSIWMQGANVPVVVFDGWPVLSIKISGDDYQNSLNSGQMAALVNLKMALGRAYAVIAHGAHDMRRLRSEEEEQLQFKTTVKKGSSILETDFTPLIQAFASAVSAQPGLAIVAATLIGLGLVAKPVILKYYDDRAKQLEAEERRQLLDLSMSAGEKKSYKLFEQAQHKIEKHYPQFAQVLPDSRESFWKFASASVDADRMTIAGLEMSQDDLELLAERRYRRQGELQEVEQAFKVVSVKRAVDSFRVGLESKNLVITAVYRKPQLTDARIKRLMTCMSNDKRVKAKLLVRTVDQAQLSGRLVSFTPLDDEL